MLLGRRQKMVYFVLFNYISLQSSRGLAPGRWSSSPGSFETQSSSLAQIRVIQCLEQAIPVVLWAAMVRSGFWGQSAGLEASMPWESRGNRGESQSIPLPLSLGEETPICCRWTYPHCLGDVHLSTAGLFILGVTKAMRVTLFGTTPVWLWITSMIP